MLDQATKRKIDNARDILVGKVPDPKSQVEQITIALIYKFMDDMDKESEEWGGKASFFTGKYEKYAWSKIFDPRLGGFDLIKLYSDAIVEMDKNPNIPQLFRDIFKNAYLPYRDPETLKSFLKEINEFTYDHSERLGDAFEYLLSAMDSQGEAGQFRTPRHIIDFIVEIVDPKKNETVLDPACGTAGFLISSYKHILRTNTKDRIGDQLTPDEKKRLMNNFTGYDISPDMVRLSLVNLYLHSFSDPKIHEYDTLTSEERWDETADVMLANPPFMTPKGGIRPHKRFSIQAKRSEVLFVDYIAEHLNPNGRAGVIVPEGIIFQSQTAYKNLRKMLVEDYLWAVVSLPAGVFQPYSGVKTSILLIDKMLVKKTAKILFVKIENDGFDLGAQRRPIDKNDLPQAVDFIKDYLQTVKSGKEVEETYFVHVVEKSKIAESGDWNLSGEKYRDNEITLRSEYDAVELDKILEIQSGYAFESRLFNEEKGFPIVRIRNIKTGFTDTKYSGEYDKKYIVDNGDLLIGMDGEFNATLWRSAKALLNQRVCKLHNFKDCLKEYVFRMIQRKLKEIENKTYSVTVKHISEKQIRAIKIPLPPLDLQKTIVAEIEGYQKIINGARLVVDNLKPIIMIDPDWETVRLDEVMLVNMQTIDPAEKYGDNRFVYIDISSIENETRVASFENLIKGTDAPSRARRIIKEGDVLLSTVRPYLKAFAYLSKVPENAIASTGFAVLTATNKVAPQFVYYLLFGEYLQKQMINRMEKGAYPSINQKDVQELKIPLPPLSVQKEIVAQIEAEQEIVNANKKLIAIYEKKIKDKIGEVWGKKL